MYVIVRFLKKIRNTFSVNRRITLSAFVRFVIAIDPIISILFRNAA